MDVREYRNTKATGRLGRHTVFELVCRLVVRADKLGEDEQKALLKKLQKFLRLPPEEAGHILAAAKVLEGPVEEGGELTAEEVFAEACALAWSDGDLADRELKILTGLAAAMRVDTSTAKRILDETFQGSMAALKAGAVAAKQAAAAAPEPPMPVPATPLAPEKPPLEAEPLAEEPPAKNPPEEKPRAREPSTKEPTAQTPQRKPPTSPKKPEASKDTPTRPATGASSAGGLRLIPDLVAGLFTAPLETLARAAEPECRVATLAIGAVGVLLPAFLSPIAQVDVKISLVNEASSFAISYLGILVGGKVTGGKGEPLPLLQMFCLVAPVLGGAAALFGLLGLGWVVGIFGLVLYYYLMMLGHGFGDLREMAFAYAVGFALMVFLFVGQAKVIHGMVEAARPVGGHYF
jgi:hypothetical protein